MKTIDWYFDFISPYAYLQHVVLERSVPGVAIRRRPILFAGLLTHWGHLGPAEIPPKRTWTFRHVAWLAERHGIALAMPTMHPFNSLPLLRLSIALGDTAAVVDRLFGFVWRDGHVPTDAPAWAALLRRVRRRRDRPPGGRRQGALRAAGDEALEAGVFGVPTAVVDGETFWGFDATPMLADRLAGAPFFASDALRAARALPVGPMRPQAVRAAS